MTFGRMSLCLAVGLLPGCGGSRPEPVTTFAAVSTQDALREAADDFQARTGVSVELNPGPSSTLARQIEQGAAADLFLSADEGWADYLSDRGLVGERRDLLGNRLVVVVGKDNDLAIGNL